MKLKFLTLLAVVGMAFAACGSDRKDGATDSTGMDTTMSAMPDTTMPDTNVMDTTTKKPVDTIKH